VGAVASLHCPPGTQRPRRFRPRFHWELLACGVGGHELIGTDAATLRAEDAVYAREIEGVRWYRCVRCDSWLPLARPERPQRSVPPPREEIELPLRGKALRDRVVLRLIAIDRALHFVVLTLLAVAVLLFASHELRLRHVFYRVANAVQGSAGGPTHSTRGGVIASLRHVFELSSTTLYAVAAAAAAYALLEGIEAVGLWLQKRWAEYLTFVATVVFIPYELYELARAVSPFKIIALLVNVAIALYLLFAKRLFGLRGGATAEREERERDVGWEALERTAPVAEPDRVAG
jgi:uncharacterized membrane protein (DUF2068 family)